MTDKSYRCKNSKITRIGKPKKVTLQIHDRIVNPNDNTVEDLKKVFQDKSLGRISYPKKISHREDHVTPPTDSDLNKEPKTTIIPKAQSTPESSLQCRLEDISKQSLNSLYNEINDIHDSIEKKSKIFKIEFKPRNKHKMNTRGGNIVPQGPDVPNVTAVPEVTAVPVVPKARLPKGTQKEHDFVPLRIVNKREPGKKSEVTLAMYQSSLNEEVHEVEEKNNGRPTVKEPETTNYDQFEMDDAPDIKLSRDTATANINKGNDKSIAAKVRKTNKGNEVKRKTVTGSATNFNQTKTNSTAQLPRKSIASSIPNIKSQTKRTTSKHKPKSTHQHNSSTVPDNPKLVERWITSKYRTYKIKVLQELTPEVRKHLRHYELNKLFPVENLLL